MLTIPNAWFVENKKDYRKKWLAGSSDERIADRTGSRSADRPIFDGSRTGHGSNSFCFYGSRIRSGSVSTDHGYGPGSALTDHGYGHGSVKTDHGHGPGSTFTDPDRTSARRRFLAARLDLCSFCRRADQRLLLLGARRAVSYADI